MKKIRPLGKVLLDLELILDEMCIEHELQLGDVLALIKIHIDIHLPDAVESYVDGGKPEFFYGIKKD